MSLTGESLEKISQLVETAQSIVIALPTDASSDTVFSAFAWHNVLTSKNKEVQLIAATSPRVDLASAKEAPEISANLGKKNLVLSFAYTPEQVDSVSYHIGEETNRFYLTIRPQKGHSPLSQESLEMSYAGAQADLIIFIGVSDLSELMPLSSEYADFFADTASISIAQNETAFGSVKLPTGSDALLCESTTQLFVQLGWTVEDSTATYLLRGIEDVTNGLTSLATTADTYETVAILLRAGARRTSRQREQRMQVPKQTHAASTPATIQTPAENARAPRSLADVLNRGSQPAPEKQKSSPSQDNSQSRNNQNNQHRSGGRYLGRKRSSQRKAQRGAQS